jgi:pilus assembly protein Flp/PilA
MGGLPVDSLSLRSSEFNDSEDCPSGEIAKFYKFSRERKKNNMKSILNSVKKFMVSEDGPTAVEYAVMLALIVIVCLTAIRAIGTNANVKFEAVRDALA